MSSADSFIHHERLSFKFFWNFNTLVLILHGNIGIAFFHASVSHIRGTRF